MSPKTSTWKQIFSHRMIMMIFLGYASGLPLLLTASTLQAWMKTEGIDLVAIGMVSLLGLPYVLKFLWAPLLDRYPLPFLGRRRGWMLFFQAGIFLSIFALSRAHPSQNLFLVSFVSLCLSFFSASQDIVIDAYRREILPTSELGLGSSIYISGYRLSMLVSGAFALYLADNMSWNHVYLYMSLMMLPALLFTFLAPKEDQIILAPRTLKEAVVGPLVDFFQKSGAWLILLFILFYKVGDSMASNMTTPFILEMGYTKTDIASVAKTFGMVATIFGGIMGGAMMLKTSMKKALFIFGTLQAVSTLGFAFLPHMSVSFTSLAAVIAIENLASGMGTAAYSAFMASLTNKQFTATQYALLTALMGVPRVILSSPTGWMAQVMGWELFFVFCTLIAIPGLLLLAPIYRRHQTI